MTAELELPATDVSAPQEAAVVPVCDDITVIARYPYQMEACQQSLIEWVKKKIAVINSETDDLAENLEIAKKHKWGTGGIHRAHARSMRTGEYYDKMLMALEAGYCILPNFPVEMFAIRTKRVTPDPKSSTSTWDNRNQKSQILPAGEGVYRDPEPIVYNRQVDFVNREGKMEKRTEHFAKFFRDEIEFPFTTAKPAILSAAARAMADKVFDEIGVLPGRRPKGDPILIGRIRDPRGDKYNEKATSFLIAWFVDTREL